MKDKKVYISGPMTGYTDFNRAEFLRMESVLKKVGAIPINPARHPVGLQYEQYMEYAMLDVKNADMLVLLPGWMRSPGALLEVAIAKELLKPIYESKVME